MVALVGRELYESSISKKPECPFCKGQLIEIRRNASDDINAWENGRCAKAENKTGIENMMYGFEYTVKLIEDESCCSLKMHRYENPFIIWVKQLI